MAGETTAAPEPVRKIPALSMLPAGSELKDVMFPSYGAAHQLTSVLKAEVMTLLNADQVEGKRVTIEFFNADNTPRGRVDMTSAMVDQSKSILTTREPVEIRIDGLSADGSGIYYDYAKGKGVLLGPATTIIHRPLKTTMNTPESPLRAMAFVGMSLMTQSLLAAPPPAITQAQLDAMQADATSRAPMVEASAVKANTTLDADLADAATASQAAAAFLVQAKLPAVKPDEVKDEPKPLEVTPGANDTVVTCDGDIYFDPEEGVMVFMKNVKVRNPQFDMSGRIDELKVFFEKKPAGAADAKKDAKKDDKSDKDKGGFGGSIGKNIGNPERVVATGAIRIDQKPVNGEPPIQASGAIFTYNVKTDEIVIKGGFPWVRKGPQYLRATKSDNLLMIYPNESKFNTSGGGWEAASPTKPIAN